MTSFADQLRAEAAAVRMAVIDTVRTVAVTLFDSVITKTPIGSPELWQSPAPPGYTGGSARSNWFLTNAAPSGEVTTATNHEQRRDDVLRGVTTLQYTGRLTLTNNLPYIERLEDGWSTQAPQGMVKLNVSRVEPMVPRIHAAACRRNGVRP